MESFLSNVPLLFGLIAAILHVLAGPDHLAAVGPIAIKSQVRSWLIGLSWGIGHIIGMLLIGILFYFFRELIPVEKISNHSEQIVGFLLIIIGIWAFWRFRSEKLSHKHIHVHQNEKGKYFVHNHEHKHNYRHNYKHDYKNNEQIEHKHKNTLEKQNILISLGIGIIHGLAGVSHIISLLPTLAFSNSTDSIMYLSGFATGTIVAMVLFATLLGIIGKYSSEQRKQLSYSVINLTAGFAAISVGIFWIWQSF